MTYLDELLTLRRASVDRQRRTHPASEIRRAAEARTERRPFAAALRSGTPALIAEFKRSSPSAGVISRHADPASTAAAYERGGAAALSVLTEPDRFGGSFDDLRAARAATTLPVLCKDFIVDEYQIWEAVAHGADAVLLIAAALDDARLAAFIQACAGLRVDALVEAHDEHEVERALGAGSTIVGINNRNLATFAVDTETAVRLRPLIGFDAIAVAESGYTRAADVVACSRAGFHAVLVGEALMRERDPERAVARLRGAVR